MSANKGKYLIILAGPTAVGKSDLAISLARNYEAEIFSCDSRQIYKEMSIGTAKPSLSEMQDIKHHFVDHISIHQPYTAGDYERDVDKALSLYFTNHDIAIMVGGTGLYIKAVTEGLDEFPEVGEHIISALQDRAETSGLSSLADELKTLDPTSYQNLDLSNERRVIRALSVCLAEGKPYSSYLKSEKKKLPYHPIFINIQRPREELYERINKRVDRMLTQGLLQEATLLHPHKTLKALQTVGYKEIFQYLDNEMTRSESTELIKRNSRRYAKRQMTWFRNQGDFWSFHPDQKDEIYSYISSFMS